MGRWAGLNRRKFPRVKYPCLIVIRNNEGEEYKEDVLLTHTENIGQGGVCLVLKKNIKIFSRVDLEIDLMDLGNNIKCSGKVVWNVQRKYDAKTKPLFYDIGVEFDDIEGTDNKRLLEIVKNLIKKNRTVPYSK